MGSRCEFWWHIVSVSSHPDHEGWPLTEFGLQACWLREIVQKCSKDGAFVGLFQGTLSVWNKLRVEYTALQSCNFWNGKVLEHKRHKKVTSSNFLASKTYPYWSFGKNNSAILAVADEDGLSQPDKCAVWGTQGCCSYELCASFKNVTPPVLPELLETAFSSLSSRVSFWHNCQLMRGGGTRG